jgi:Putative zinc-finger
MESCARLLELFPEYAEGELSPQESGRVSIHIGECASCQLRVRRHRDLLTALHSLPQVVPPDHFRQSTMSRVAEAPLPGRAFRRGHLRLVKAVIWFGLAGAAGGAGRLGAILFGRDFPGRAGLLPDPSFLADQLQNMGRLALSLLMEIATRTQVPGFFLAPHNLFTWGGLLSLLLLSGLAAAAVGVGVFATARVLLSRSGD